MQDREEWLADTLVVLADTLIAGFDVIEFLSMLAERIQELLAASGVGLVLADPQGRLRVMASSSERMRLLELFEMQVSEGPCFECYRSGQGLLNVDLDDSVARWPAFTPMARSSGFRLVHALPMRLRERVIGAANIFHAAASPINERDAGLAQALADVATIGLLQERALRSATDLTSQLQGALNSRVVIEQAKGAVAEGLGVDMDSAFARLRSYARNNGLRLADVALAIADRTLPVTALGASAPGPVGTPQSQPGSP